VTFGIPLGKLSLTGRPIEISDEELAANYTFINEKAVHYEISDNKKTFHVGKWARVNNWGGSGRVRIEIN